MNIKELIEVLRMIRTHYEIYLSNKDYELLSNTIYELELLITTNEGETNE